MQCASSPSDERARGFLLPLPPAAGAAHRAAAVSPSPFPAAPSPLRQRRSGCGRRCCVWQQRGNSEPLSIILRLEPPRSSSSSTSASLVRATWRRPPMMFLPHRIWVEWLEQREVKGSRAPWLGR